VVIVEEGVAGVGVFLHIVGHAYGRQDALQAVGNPAIPAIFGALTRDDGAGARQQRFGILRKSATVVHTRS
jgi:hypothetical protein